MQTTIYKPEDEQELMATLWTPAIADDPEAFVLFAFPWGQENTPLANFKGPRKWQREVLREITAHIKRQKAALTLKPCATQSHLAEVLVSQPLVSGSPSGCYPHA
jgi:hypothetical protein